MNTARIYTGICLIALLAVSPLTAHAITTSKGLSVSPPRHYIEVEAGQTKTDKLTVYNFTDTKMSVDLSVEEFSVSDYSYEYRFAKPRQNIVYLGQSNISIEPRKSHQLDFSVITPANSAPGGLYYTIVASATVQQNGVPSKMQVATPLYIAVKGKQTFTSSLESHSIKKLVFGDHIPFTLDIRNTGNVHYFAYVSGSVSGLLTKNITLDASHLLLPDTVRRVEASVPSPMLPGVYKATYGYKTDSSEPVAIEAYVIYTPLWSYAFLLLAAWGMAYIVKRRLRRTKTTGSQQ